MSSESTAGPPRDLPRIINGYKLVRELGRDKLGPVVLSTQRATGQNVAWKVIKPEWSCLPKYVARLTRQAFAAAQVDQPNLVRLIDFGEAQSRVYFVSELHDGSSLADRVSSHGALPLPQAIAHVLQAARGLRYAHNQGLAHGSVSAANLLVDDDGLTRVSNLGLTQTPAIIEADDLRDTRGPIEMGADAQAEATAAPFRADIRGLGLTLAYLLTGRDEVHPNALISAGLPMNVVELIRTMVEPRPGSGHADMNQLITTLERVLNGRSAGATTPREDDTRLLTRCASIFDASPSAKIRKQIVLGSIAVCAIVVLMGLAAGKPRFTASVLGLATMISLADFVVAGVTGRSSVFPRVRRLIMESRGVDRIIALTIAILFIAALFSLRLHGAWLAMGIFAVVAAIWFHIMVDRKVESERRDALNEARALLKKLRLQGVSEESLRQFVRSATGSAFFESLFGESVTRATREPSERGLKALLLRGQTSVLRDALNAWIEARQEARARERDWIFLQRIEERGLVAEGVNLVTARRKARRIAEAMVTTASEIRADARAHASRPGEELSGHESIGQAVRRAVEAPENVLVERETGPIADPDRWRWLLDLFCGPRTRFLLGAAVLAGFFLWVHENEVVSSDQIKDVATRALESDDPLASIRNAHVDVRLDVPARPVSHPLIPKAIAHLFQGFNAGVAGLILIVSSLFHCRFFGFFALPGSAVALLGPSFGWPSATCMALGFGIAALGLLFGGRTYD